jgi:hypothetical protein
MRRVLFTVALTTIIFALCFNLGFAQISTTPQPDAGVRGSGAIATSSGNAGAFDINVAKFGAALAGGFRYMEVTPTATRANVIISQAINDLQINGGAAVIKASGFWNGMPSDLIVEVLDAASGDHFHIVATPVGTPTGPTIQPYDEGGPLTRGDIVVFSGPPVPDAFAKGIGTISLNPNIGRFEFASAEFGDNVKGNIMYVEMNPMVMSAMSRPKVVIYCPAVQALTVTGNSAVLTGNGTLNGRPAAIEVGAIHNSLLGGQVAVPDHFHIKATPLNPSSTMPGYEAEGDLKTGDIVVGTN